jgi:hypothetical protein
MESKLILLGIFALFGFFLLRGGITGNAISQSCCFPPSCAPENMCTATGASIEKPAYMSPDDNTALSAVGLLLLVISTAMVFGYLKIKITQDKQKEPNFTQ